MKDPHDIGLGADDRRAAIEPLLNYTQSLAFEAIELSEATATKVPIKTECDAIVVDLSDFVMHDSRGLQGRAWITPRYRGIAFMLGSGGLDKAPQHRGLVNNVSGFGVQPDTFYVSLGTKCRHRMNQQQKLAKKRLWCFLHIYRNFLPRLKSQLLTASLSIASKLRKGYDFLSQLLQVRALTPLVPIIPAHRTSRRLSTGLGKGARAITAIPTEPETKGPVSQGWVCLEASWVCL